MSLHRPMDIAILVELDTVAYRRSHVIDSSSKHLTAVATLLPETAKIFSPIVPIDSQCIRAVGCFVKSTTYS